MYLEKHYFHSNSFGILNYIMTWFWFHGQQDVRGRDCGVGRLSEAEQSGDGIRLQLLPSSRRPRNLLKLAGLKMILEVGTRNHAAMCFDR